MYCHAFGGAEILNARLGSRNFGVVFEIHSPTDFLQVFISRRRTSRHTIFAAAQIELLGCFNDVLTVLDGAHLRDARVTLRAVDEAQED